MLCTCKGLQLAQHPRLGSIVARVRNPVCVLHGNPFKLPTVDLTGHAEVALPIEQVLAEATVAFEGLSDGR